MYSSPQSNIFIFLNKRDSTSAIFIPMKKIRTRYCRDGEGSRERLQNHHRAECPNHDRYSQSLQNDALCGSQETEIHALVRKAEKGGEGVNPRALTFSRSEKRGQSSHRNIFSRTPSPLPILSPWHALSDSSIPARFIM